MLFLKYISDLWDEHVETYRERYGDDEARIRRRLSRERFVLPESASFRTLYEQRGEPNIGELVNIALEAIEDSNRAKLEGVFRNVDFNSEANLGRTKDRNRRLKNLLEDFAKPALDLRHVQGGRRRDRGVLHLPDFALCVGRRQEGGRVLHPVLGVPAPRQAGRAEGRRHDLRSGVRLGLAADPRGGRGRVAQLLALRPGGERRDLGAGPDEHVPAREGRRPRRLVQHADRSHPDRGRPAQDLRRRGRQPALLAQEVGRGARGRRSLRPLLARRPPAVQGRTTPSSPT